MHGMLPPEVFASCSPAARREEILAYQASLDNDAAELLAMLAEHPSTWWENRRNATIARRILRQVADHLRSSRP